MTSAEGGRIRRMQCWASFNKPDSNAGY